MKNIAKVLLLGLVASPVVYVSSCSYLSHSRRAAFDAVVVGDSQETVARKFGSSVVIERSKGQPFLRYASQACTMPCVERWWLENRMALDTEAWSVEFDQEGRVVRKVTWSSP